MVGKKTHGDDTLDASSFGGGNDIFQFADAGNPIVGQASHVDQNVTASKGRGQRSEILIINGPDGQAGVGKINGFGGGVHG